MSRLEKIAEQIASISQPPVDQWQPKTLGDIDIVIDSMGHWFHEGDPILREPLIRLFASILWHENGDFFLVTPVEKLAIQVADVPYLVNQVIRTDNAWVATTNTHEQVIVGQENPVELREYQGTKIPYVRIRYDLWARVNRSIYFQWATEAIEQQHNENTPLILTSGDYEFVVAG